MLFSLSMFFMQVQWNDSKKLFSGVIDLGNSLIDKDSTEPATNALVYLVNSVNGYWKIPVAYYFVNSLTANEKASILLNVLKAIEDTGAEVVSVLGGQVYSAINIKSFFPHPITRKPVYIFLDVCHMLKLLRNNLGNTFAILIIYTNTRHI